MKRLKGSEHIILSDGTLVYLIEVLEVKYRIL